MCFGRVTLLECREMGIRWIAWWCHGIFRSEKGKGADTIALVEAMEKALLALALAGNVIVLLHPLHLFVFAAKDNEQLPLERRTQIRVDVPGAVSETRDYPSATRSQGSCCPPCLLTSPRPPHPAVVRYTIS